MSRLQVEERIAALEERTRALEAWAGLAGPPPPRPETIPPPRPEVVAPVARRETRSGETVAPPRRAIIAPPSPASPRLGSFADFEDALGGRALAWVGGLAVALGVVFLLAIAVSRGWIGEVERTLLAGIVSAALLGTGIWAHGRRGRTDASLAATAAGIAGLFATVLVAGAVYELIPVVVAMIAAVAVGATATALAVRWAAPGIAALGILGALSSPALFDALDTPAGVGLLLIATASATGVLLWQRWTWLAFAAFAIATPQWLAFLAFGDPGQALTLAVLASFGVLSAAAAVGFEVRARAKDVRIPSILLLGLNALVLALAGAVALDAADAWLVALAVLHLGVGVAGRKSARISPDLAIAATAIGVVLADIAAGRLLDGLPLVVGWAASGVVFAGLTRYAVPGKERNAALAGLGGHLLLALSHALLDAPPQTISGGGADLVAQAGLVVVAATSLISGRLAEAGRATVQITLDTVALAVLAYVTAVTLDGLALTVALAAEAAVPIAIARRQGEDVVAHVGAVVFAALTGLHAFTVLAPADALLVGLDEPLAAAAGLGAAALVAALTALLRPDDPRWVAAARGIAALTVLYAASVELVTPFADTPQQAQALLSGLWALVGVGTLLAGLLRDRAVLRHAALALLGVTAAKVFLYDLASLTSLYRVASFIALGLLLLAGAFAWQRVRPRPLPDLRQMPGSLR